MRRSAAVTMNAQTRHVESPLGRVGLCNAAAPGNAQSQDLVETDSS